MPRPCAMYANILDRFALPPLCELSVLGAGGLPQEPGAAQAERRDECDEHRPPQPPKGASVLAANLLFRTDMSAQAAFHTRVRELSDGEAMEL
eukprot:6213420-Pleurochrysis_carterae.AAC.2